MPAPDLTLQAYARRLANLSGQNKALLFLKPSAQQDIDLLDLDFAAGKPAWQILAQLVEGPSKIALCSLGQDGGRDGELNQRLKQLARKAHSISEETGSQDLHLGWPLATGRWATDALVRAPLLLWPVRLWVQSGHWYLGPQPGAGLAFNKAFLLGLAHFNGVALAPELIDEDFDEAPKDFLAFRTWLYQKLKAAELPIHFNQDLFFEPLQPLKKYKKDELLKETKTGAIKLMPEAVLGLFPQADSYMGSDYAHLQASAATVGAVLKRQAPVYDTPHPIWPLATDGSQEALLLRLRQGQSLCVQGPPGTGKSQLIANAVADALAAGKRVLVVCQKRAALEVVQTRLAAVGLGPWLASVYDFRADRPALFDSIAAQLATLPDAPQQVAQLCQAADPHQYAANASQLATIDAELEAFREALFSPNASGLSTKSLYMALRPGSPKIGLDTAYLHFPYPLADAFGQTLAQLDSYRHSLQGLHPFWTLRHSFFGATQADLVAHIGLLEAWPAHKRNLEDVACKAALSLKEARRWLVRLSKPAFISGLQKATLACSNPEVASWARTFATSTKIANIKRLYKKSTAVYTEQPFARAIAQQQLSRALASMQKPDTQALLRALQEAKAAQPRGAFPWFLYRLFGRNSQSVMLALPPQGPLNARLATAEASIRAWQQVAAFRANALQQLPALALLLPEDPADVQGWQYGLGVLTQALRVARFFKTAKLNKPVQKVFFADIRTRKAYQDRVLAVAKDLAQWTREARARWSKPQIAHILRNKQDTLAVAKSLHLHFDVLVECDALSHGLSNQEQLVLKKLLKAGPALAAAGGLAPLFAQSLVACWVAHAEQAHPQLRLAAGPLLAHRHGVVLQALQKRQTQAASQVLLRLLAEAQAATTDNRASKELAHQVRKKRQLWSVRRLLATYFNTITRLLPCWLASPETVSALMPFAHGLFDLVIFDEASQCFAERGLPAAWRGSQLLIAGDSHQLTPSDIYRIRYEGADEAESADSEAVSLLDLALLHLPEAHLESHYRSARPELIAFSNFHFYKERLHVLPQYQTVRLAQPAISVVPVPNGLWDNRQNIPEAQMVVAAILAHINQSQTHTGTHPTAQTPAQTLGVVTFNQPQQALLQDMLEAAAAAQGVHIPPSLFIKNIENVQGDERDHIFFSLGYGPDAGGNIRLQFGSLSQPGGENRLNVAITRARRHVRIFASLAATDLSRAATAAPGARLLAAYLAYAEAISAGKQAHQLLTTAPPAPGSLAARLASAEPTLTAALPFSDLTIVEQGVPAALIFTDDARLQSAPSARDYLIMRPALAQQLGWPTQQRWSRDLTQNMPL